MNRLNEPCDKLPPNYNCWLQLSTGERCPGYATRNGVTLLNTSERTIEAGEVVCISHVTFENEKLN